MFEKDNRPLEVISGANVCDKLMSLLENVKRTYEYDERRVKELEEEQLDRLHEMEFLDVGTVEGFAMYKKLQHTRRLRRILKNEMRELEPLYKLIKQQSGFMGQLPHVQSNCRKQHNNIKELAYAPRTKEVMTVDESRDASVRYTMVLKDMVEEINQEADISG